MTTSTTRRGEGAAATEEVSVKQEAREDKDLDWSTFKEDDDYKGYRFPTPWPGVPYSDLESVRRRVHTNQIRPI
jgi:hypothetical protein